MKILIKLALLVDLLLVLMPSVRAQGAPDPDELAPGGPGTPPILRAPAFPSGQAPAGGSCSGVLLVAAGADTFSTADMFHVTNNGDRGITRVVWDLTAESGAFWDLDGSASFGDALEPVIGTTVGMNAADVTWSGDEFLDDGHPAILIATISPPMDPGDSFRFGADTDFYKNDPCPGGNFGSIPPAMVIAGFEGIGDVGGMFSQVNVERSEACLQCNLTFDFETEDDFATPLVNGQHVDSEFGALVTLTSSGANQGLAIFDSTVGGPNDPSQDLDLLAGTGNILILQTENLPPDASDVFPRPNDDEDGGTITFTFDVAVEPRSLRLIDVDSGDGTSTVVLTDGSARQRTYTVPSNWTGDRTLAQPGQGTLDLTTLLAQPGFGSIATASETAGFDPSDVLRLDVDLNGSAGLDDLSVCSTNLPRASATIRNGSGVNPVLLTPVSLPVLGATWRANLDCRAYGAGLALLELRRWSVPGATSPFGEVLIGGDLLHGSVRAYSGSTTRLTWNIPDDIALCGLEVHVQGLCQASVAGAGRPKTMGGRARLSNALDLVLGF